MANKWVKLEGSDVRLEYPMKRVQHQDGRFHFEPDQSQPPKRVPVTPLILEDHGNGIYTHWSFGIFGPVGHAGTLKDGAKAVPLQTKTDFEELQRIERFIASSLESQQAMFVAMGGKLGDQSA